MTFFQQAVLFEGGLGVAAIAAGGFLGYPFWLDCSCNGHTVLQTAVACVPMLVMYFVTSNLPFRSLREIDRIIRQLVQREMKQYRFIRLFIICALAGFGEEFLFRGLLQNGLITYFGQSMQVPVLVGVSLLFGFAHNITRMYFVLAFLISLYLGLVMIWTQNLFVPAAVHGLYDLFVLMYIKAGSE
jgi:membrane protease YdiL (CAAX protease family)